jgi:hypothetical protein
MPRKAKQPFGAKAAFVRAHLSTPPNELVKLAEQEGITLTVGHIYNIRSKLKKQVGDAPAAGAEPAAARLPAPRERDTASLDAQLRTLVIRIGLDRAEKVFSELKASLARFV